MSVHDVPSVPRWHQSSRGHDYNNIQINEKAHLGDTYNISQENPLSLLPFAANASFNSSTRQHESTCLPNTRVAVLQKTSQWADSEDQQCLFWLSGMAGTGKSTIAHTVARNYFEQGRLAASFFFSRGGGDAGNASKFVTTIAIQLAVHIPPVERHIRDAVTACKIIASQSLADQWRQLVLKPLLKLEGNDTYRSYIMIIDALDECEDEKDIRIILRLLAEARSLKKVRLRALITSRPEVPIRNGFCKISDAEHHDFILHDMEAAIVDHDIFIFLEHQMGLIGQEWCLGASWPGEQALRRLVINASGLFIWAATAYRFINEGRHRAAKRLSMMLKGSTSTRTPEHHLNDVYLKVLKSTIHEEDLEEDKEDTYSMLKQVLGTIVLLYSPLSTKSLSELLSFPIGAIEGGLADLHAILNIPKDTSRALRLHHPSFRDFLLNKDRCSDPNFWIDKKQAHQALADRCVRLMSTSLKQDICGLNTPGVLVSDVESSRVERSLPPEAQYACLYWIQHFHKSGAQYRDDDQVHQFLQVHLLHWLEALGWMGKTSEGIHAILSLEAQIQADKSPSLHAFIHDVKRFALYNRLMIEQAPLQIYCSALVFAPEKSIIRRRFEKYIPPSIQIKLKVQGDWSAALQTLEGHLGSVNSVAFSPDGKLVVSGSYDGTVRLWDAVTGAALQTLEGHSAWVNSVAVSLDGKLVVSGSGDRTVRLWDAVTGAALQTLGGHSKFVRSVAFSPDSKLVVSGSGDRTVQLWDAVTGTALQTLVGHSDAVLSVDFSPDSKLVVSGSADKTVQLWDAVTGTALQTLVGHLNAVQSVAFSLDGKLVVSGSGDRTVQLWDAVTGAALQTLVGHLDAVESVAFSPDSKLVVSGSSDRTVRLWDAVTRAALQTLWGHSRWVKSVAFSPDGKIVVSGSGDRTVQLWDAALQTLEDHSSLVNSMAFSPDGKLIVSGSDDKMVRLWNAVTGAALQTFAGHSRWVKSVAFSPDGKLVVSGSGDRTVRLWDAVMGAALQTFVGHSDEVQSVNFSPDSKLIVSGSDDKMVRLWNAVTGAALQTLAGHSKWVKSVAFSPDGKLVVSGSGDRTVQLWDAVTGAALQTFVGHSDTVQSVAFLSNSKLVVSGSSDRTARLWDAVKGAALQTLEGHLGLVTSVAFSPDGNIAHPLFVSNNWVAEGGSNLLWLPPTYRATCWAVWNKIIVLGHSSKRISILEFKEGL
ncbi:putative WD-repeat protein [Bisporella sp. PMI_857]|nr:putative WD-repeat protein [Bisporella sp. PMI_857]